MKTYRPSRGFTLVEIVVALFIVGVSIAVASSVGASIKSAGDAQSANLALRIAATELDELRAGGYANLPATGSFTNSNLSSLASSTASTTISDYNVKTKQVIAGVAWRASDGKMRYTALTTLITQVGGL